MVLSRVIRDTNRVSRIAGNCRLSVQANYRSMGDLGANAWDMSPRNLSRSLIKYLPVIQNISDSYGLNLLFCDLYSVLGMLLLISLCIWCVM